MLKNNWIADTEISSQNKSTILFKIDRFLADIFTVGDYYYYVLDIANSTISHLQKDALRIHNLEDYPLHLKEIIDLIHPDDLPFVIEAESWILGVYKKIGLKHQCNLKSEYCIRMKVSDNQYHLFHHQSIHITKDSNDRLLQTINIQTNIQHITSVNNLVVRVRGIKTRNDFYQKVLKVLKVEKIKKNLNEQLTKREIEIMLLLIKGYNDKEITEILCISYHTVRTHHKNILSKTKSKNSLELLQRSLENGYM